VSIEQSDVIDFVSIDQKDNLVLTISDHLAWDEEMRHLFLLQEKINAYLRFLESGEVYEYYPDSRSKNVIIHVVCAHKLDQRSMEMFERFQEAVQGAGFTLTTEYVPTQS
jgi:hypothetical protein